MGASSLDRLCQELQQEFERDPKGKGIARILGAYAHDQDDWRDLCFFDGGRYTRNLVHRCGTFELLLLCWDVDQASPIHDHSGQDCWMAVLDGQLQETHYQVPSSGPPSIECGNTRTFSRGQVAYIADQIALHLIRPVDGARGVSLHLYSSPIDTCRIYDAETGAPSQVEMDYFSVLGERCERSASEVRAEWAARA